jgi:SH3 domain-containing YSC84-like protein 1
MKKVSILLAAMLMVAFAIGCSSRDNDVAVNAKGQPVSGDKAESVNRLKDSATKLEQLASAPDDGIPQEVLKEAKCVAIVPDMVKGGFVVGAQHGRGVATCRIPGKGWSSPAFFTMTGGSWGAQIGAQSVDLVMMIMNDEGMRQLLASEWEIGGEGSVAAGPVGREASANTDWKLRSQILTYSRTRGLFAGLTLKGAKVRPDVDSTTAFYGRNYDFNTLLTGKVPAPADARAFLASVRQNFREANVEARQ